MTQARFVLGEGNSLDSFRKRQTNQRLKGEFGENGDVMENKLIKLRLKGFASIEETTIDFAQLNVMIGANGSGKSNLIKFFNMLSHMLSSPVGGLQQFVLRDGGAGALLHDGPKRTREIVAELTLKTGQGTNEYRFRLFYAAADTLIFAEEACRFSAAGRKTENQWLELGAGHREAALLSTAGNLAKKTVPTIRHLLRRLVVYQFQDTSENARVMQRADIYDSRHLKHDGGNLAAFLLRLRDSQPRHYTRIVETIRQIAPFFDDFVLESQSGTVMLQWRELGSDVIFSAYQASDGTLRAMALVALLLQPIDTLPSLLILDEPELGLHPYAIAIIGGLIRGVSLHCQVLIATQSPMLLDQFDAADVVVVERWERSSSFRRLDEKNLANWLDEYSLSDLWGRNVLGGRPREGAAA